MSHSGWEELQALRMGILLCFLPALVYRIWRLWRYPTSVPAVAATGFGMFVWLWLLAFTDQVWSVLPPFIRVVSAGGWWTVAMAACLQVFVVGIRGDMSALRIRRGLWITFVVTALCLVVVAIGSSRSEMLRATSDMFTVVDSLVVGGDYGSSAAALASNGFVIVVFIQLAWVGLRHADRTPVGTGLGLLAAASVLEIVAIALGGILLPLGFGGVVIKSSVWLWIRTIVGCIGAFLIIAGFFWPPVVLRIRARRDERRLTPLHDAMTALFPQLFPPKELRIRLSDLVFEWESHIQDGLTLLAQAREVPLTDDRPAAMDLPERAAAVARWVVGQTIPGFSYEWLRAPDGVSDQDWVLAIADAYRERQDGLAAPASLSGMPSTLRR